MGDVISFHRREPDDIIDSPQTKQKYQQIMKDSLERGDYEDFILGIMDEEYYDELDSEIKLMVDYYNELTF